MANSQLKKTIGLYVDNSYPYKGKEVKSELDAFFAYLWKNERSKSVMAAYQNWTKIKEILDW